MLILMKNYKLQIILSKNMYMNFTILEKFNGKQVQVSMVLHKGKDF